MYLVIHKKGKCNLTMNKVINAILSKIGCSQIFEFFLDCTRVLLGLSCYYKTSLFHLKITWLQDHWPAWF